MTERPYTQLVAAVLRDAGHPLTLDEIKARVEMIRPVDTHDPRATLRGAISSIRLAASLGGRPARYTWWPRHLAGNSLRQPLASSDLRSGTLVLDRETRLTLWPEFFGDSRRERQVTIDLEDGPTIETQVEHLVPMEPVWGLPAAPALAAWYRRQGVTPEDALILRVLDVDARRHALEVCRHADRDEGAITARNWELADTAEAILRTARPPTPCYNLFPRLVAYGAYRDPLPPDLCEDVLRDDLRFVMQRYGILLAGRMVDSLERDLDVPPDFAASPRPPGDRRRLYAERVKGSASQEAQRAWGEYLFDRGMDHLWVNWPEAAEAFFREALRIDPGHADAWVHMGNICFKEGQVTRALGHYVRAQALAEARVIGDPAEYPDPFWGDLETRPFMRALHGRGLCLWRLGETNEAREIFAWMLELNPNDNQGARFLLRDLDEGLSWEEATEYDDA